MRIQWRGARLFLRFLDVVAPKRQQLSLKIDVFAFVERLQNSCLKFSDCGRHFVGSKQKTLFLSLADAFLVCKLLQAFHKLLDLNNIIVPGIEDALHKGTVACALRTEPHCEAAEAGLEQF